MKRIAMMIVALVMTAGIICGCGSVESENNKEANEIADNADLIKKLEKVGKEQLILDFDELDKKSKIKPVSMYYIKKHKLANMKIGDEFERIPDDEIIVIYSTGEKVDPEPRNNSCHRAVRFFPVTHELKEDNVADLSCISEVEDEYTYMPNNIFKFLEHHYMYDEYDIEPIKGKDRDMIDEDALDYEAEINEAEKIDTKKVAENSNLLNEFMKLGEEEIWSVQHFPMYKGDRIYYDSIYYIDTTNMDDEKNEDGEVLAVYRTRETVNYVTGPGNYYKAISFSDYASGNEQHEILSSTSSIKKMERKDYSEYAFFSKKELFDFFNEEYDNCKIVRLKKFEDEKKK